MFRVIILEENIDVNMERFDLISEEEYDKVDFPENSLYYKVVDVIMLGGGNNTQSLHEWLGMCGCMKLSWTTCDELSQIVSVSSKNLSDSLSKGCYRNHGVGDVMEYSHYRNVLCIENDVDYFKELVARLLDERHLYVRKKEQVS